MKRAAMKRAFTALVGALVALVFFSPALALACPQCAGRSDGGGVARGIMLGLFILFPFAVVGTVWRVLHAESAASGGGHSESGS
jgi:hypothetical protein